MCAGERAAPGTPVQDRSIKHQRATVAGLDAAVVFTASKKENAKATYRGGVGFVPNLATCDNVDDALATGPRPGERDLQPRGKIALLDLAVSRLPRPFRRRLLVRLDGAGVLP